MTGPSLPEQGLIPPEISPNTGVIPNSSIQRLGNFIRQPGRRLATGLSVAAVALFAYGDHADDSAAVAPIDQENTPITLYTKIDVNQSSAVSGADLTSEHGFAIYMFQPGDEAVTVYENDKTIFVGVRRSGDKNISTCGTLSRWEAKKYDVKVVEPESDNPCTIQDMNDLKNRYNFGKRFNGKAKIDGTYSTPTDTDDKRCDDPSLYRDFTGYSESAVNKDPAHHHGFETPLKVDDGSVAVLTSTMIVHYRFEFDFDDNGGERAARVRIDPEQIDGLTDTERDAMNEWFVVDRNCLPDKIKMNGPDKSDDARRGKRPNSGQD